MIRTRVNWSGTTGAPYLSTFYHSGDGSGGDAQLAVNAIGTFLAGVDARLNTVLTWASEPDVAVLTDGGVQTGVVTTTPVSGSGSTSGDILPLATQGLIRWITDDFVNGRNVRGRFFIPAPLEGDNTASGAVLSGAVTVWLTAATTFIGAVGPALRVWSRTNGTSHDVTSASVSSTWAVLRSRRD